MGLSANGLVYSGGNGGLNLVLLVYSGVSKYNIDGVCEGTGRGVVVVLVVVVVDVATVTDGVGGFVVLVTVVVAGEVEGEGGGLLVCVLLFDTITEGGVVLP